MNGNHLSDASNSQLTAEVIGWRDAVETGTYEPADSAGFYWAATGMAKHADQAHVPERQVVEISYGNKIYYRSPAFWKASAAVNLPRRVDNLYHPALNGFTERCCAYSNALAVLTEIKFPDAVGARILETPESDFLRRS